MNKIMSFLKRHFQCRWGIHWVKTVDIAETCTCPDCGKFFEAVVWDRE